MTRWVAFAAAELVLLAFVALTAGPVVALALLVALTALPLAFVAVMGLRR